MISTSLPPQYNSMSLRLLQKELNEKFGKAKESIRVTNIRWANDGFDITQSLGKTYVYRLGLLPSEMEDLDMEESDMNILNYKTAGFVRKPDHGFNMENFHLAAGMLRGINDFSLFRLQPLDLKRKCLQRVVRSVSIYIERGQPSPLSSFSSSHFDRCEYWNIVVSGQGFMHKQIRYMVGAMTGVGTGTLLLPRLEEILKHPERGIFRNEIPVAAPYGLYLTSITYAAQSFHHEESTND